MKIRTVALFAILLTIPALTMTAQDSPAHKAQIDKDMREVQNYTLTLDIVSRAFQALHDIGEAVKADPSLREAARKNSENDKDSEQQKTLDQMAALTSSSPKIVAIISAHGFTPRGLMLAQMTFVQTALAVASLDAGSTTAEVIGEGQTNPANVKLFREHKAEIDALVAKYPVSSSE